MPISRAIDIPFHRIPGHSALFLNYIQRSPDALRFYQRPPEIEALERGAQEGIGRLQFPRREIASILRRQNQGYGADAETLRQIEELEQPDSFAILTGQQVGLFTGPLYTVYKALTAVRIAERLRERGIRAVPVFWMDTEDHDLQEITHVSSLGRDGALQNIDYRGMLFGEMGSVPLPAGSIAFPEGIRRVLGDYLNRLPEGPGRFEVARLISESCQPGASFTSSFARILSSLLRGSGLVLYDPHDPEAKRLTSGVFTTALREHEAIRRALIERSRELEHAGFHAQVGIMDRSTVLFFLDDGARRALEQTPAGFALKNSGRTFTLDELLDLAHTAPESFSPNVLLRPLVQDHLFPTLAYVGGPAEVAYFAQIETLYAQFRRPMPAIWPRNSFTLIGPDTAAELKRMGLTIEDCLASRDSAAQKAGRKSELSGVVEKVDRLQVQIERELAELRPEIERFEPPLARALDNARRKMLRNLDRVRQRVSRIGETRSAIDALANICYPNEGLQERSLSIHHFAARDGYALVDTIRAATDPGNFSHRLIRL